WMRSRYPEAGVIHSQWSGQIIETVDGMAYIGRNPGEKNVYIVTGDSGNGLTHGTIAGILIPDLIQGRENPWEGVYDPARITLKATGEFGRHNLKVAAHYADWLKSHGTADEAAIQPGSGAVIKEGLKPIAAYRDEQGVMHRMSAVCPHLKCIVTWNGSEKSWDCPCHGSRFNCRGHVLNGPANEDLAHLDSVVQATPDARGGATLPGA
ncbi:MAG: FAD-dependent oxidoreductase, partial [Fibrobacterota bacterium]|nr:FAD-dependent oxidoreductase [Fibrobacterota bacterium]